MTWVVEPSSYQQLPAQLEWICYAAQQNDLDDEGAFAALFELKECNA